MHRDTNGGPPCGDWSKTGTSQRLPAPPGAGRVREGLWPWALRRSTALSAPWLPTSGLQHWERISFCCFQSPLGSNLLQHPRGLHILRCLRTQPMKNYIIFWASTVLCFALIYSWVIYTKIWTSPSACLRLTHQHGIVFWFPLSISIEFQPYL